MQSFLSPFGVYVAITETHINACVTGIASRLFHETVETLYG